MQLRSRLPSNVFLTRPAALPVARAAGSVRGLGFTRTAALVLAALITLALPSIAAAHGGNQVFGADRGSYRIRAFASLTDGWLDYSIDLREIGSGKRVTDALVSVTALTPSGLQGPWDALFTGTVYEMIERAPDEVDWTMQVDIATATGPVTYAHRLRLMPSTWVWPTIAVGGGFVAAVAAHAYSGWRRRNRKRAQLERTPTR